MSLVEVPVECLVKQTDKYQPLTGVHSVETTIPGWRWDRKILPSEYLSATRYNTFIGGHSFGLRDGTKLSDWQSGTLSGCEYEDLVFVRENNKVRWVPRVTTGEYSVYWDRRPLFSDYSTSINLTTDLVSAHGYLYPLEDEAYGQAVVGSTFVAIWRRLSDFTIVTALAYKQVDEFTPLPDYATTEDVDGNIIWAQVSDVHNEYIIDDDHLMIFNNMKSIDVAMADTYEDYVVDSWEYKGVGSSNGRTLFADYFPFEMYSVRVASVDDAGNITIWDEVSSFRNTLASDKVYIVNYDLGTIEMGGFEPSNLFLDVNLNDSATELTVFPDSDTVAEYPDQGVIRIGAEKIFYAERGHAGFYQLTRGYDGTTAVAHSKGSKIFGTQQGQGTTDDIYISYRAVPRVDVEVSTYELRTANKNKWVDVRANSNASSNNILQILSANVNVAEILLSIDRPIIGGTLYGPIYYGTDSARLTATALDAKGNPVEDVDLTISITSGIGVLDGSQTEVTKNSNPLGQIYSAFHAPYSSVESTFEVISVTHDSGDTLMEVASLPKGLSVDDIWVYQILKRDPFAGTIGRSSTVYDAGASSFPNGDAYIVVDSVIDTDLTGGKIYVLTTTGVKRSHEIVYSEVYVDLVDNHTYTKLYVMTPLVPLHNIGQSCWILSADDIEWDPVLKRGQRVILYEWNASAEHPLTHDPGAYCPVHPSSLSGTTLTFTGRTLTLPSATDDTVEVGGYIIIAPGETRFIATAVDPYTNQAISSNRLRVKITLPQSLLGVDSSGALPVPYGFKFVTDDFNIGSGLGGANFYTINPRASGINAFSLTGVFP